MRILCLQHVPFEGPGTILTWAQERDYQLRVCHIYRDEDPGRHEDYELLILMGGPMSVNDCTSLPWMEKELTFLREAIASEKTVLGICLGAQLIAAALGSKVYSNGEREIGWFPISRNISDTSSLFDSLPPELIAFHWHGETFELPPGAELLASSTACEVQAFQYEKRVLGLQFHLEVDRAQAAELCQHCAEDLRAGTYVQTSAEILEAPAHFAAIRNFSDIVLDRLVEKN